MLFFSNKDFFIHPYFYVKSTNCSLCKHGKEDTAYVLALTIWATVVLTTSTYWVFKNPVRLVNLIPNKVYLFVTLIPNPIM